MAQSAADQKTMTICYGRVDETVSKIKNISNEIEDIARYLQTQDLSGGDGDLITQGIRDGVTVLRNILDKEKKDLLTVLDDKIAGMRSMTSDQSNIAGTNRNLKEAADNVEALKR